MPEYEYVAPDDKKSMSPAGGLANNRPLLWGRLLGGAGCVAILLMICAVSTIGRGIENLSTFIDRLLAEELAPGEPPQFGEILLEPGFSPAPFTRQVSSEGDIDVFAAGLPEECRGYVQETPTFHLRWSGQAEAFDVAFTADEGDAVLVVHDPAGNWHCNDDFNGLDPTVAIFNPAGGGYDIWVGVYASGASISGVLAITEPAGVILEDSRLDPELVPLFGSDELSAGFSPDPFTTTLDAGGPVHIGRAVAAMSPAGDSGDCIGHTTDAPSFRLNWSGQAQELRLFFVSFSAAADPTLAVLDPAGSWHCNDDAQTTDPLVQITTPETGIYLIWVGTYTEEDSDPGTLYVSQQDVTVLDIIPGATITETGELLPQEPPTYGRESLSAGFAPQPFITNVVSGGDVAAINLRIGADCVGYVSSAPDFRLEWTGETSLLHFSFAGGDDSDDGTLIIYDPDGEYHCNDDADGLNPAVEIANPPAGVYQIWIGSYSFEEYISGELSIYE